MVRSGQLTAGSQHPGQPLAVHAADLVLGAVLARVEHRGALVAAATPRDVARLSAVARVGDVVQTGDCNAEQRGITARRPSALTRPMCEWSMG